MKTKTLSLIALSLIVFFNCLNAQDDSNITLSYKIDNAFFQRAFKRTYLNAEGNVKFGIEVIGGNPIAEQFNTGEFLYSLNAEAPLSKEHINKALSSFGKKASEDDDYKPPMINLVGGIVSGFRPVTFYANPYEAFEDGGVIIDSIYQDIIVRTSAHFGLSIALPFNTKVYVGSALTFGKDDLSIQSEDGLYSLYDQEEQYLFGFTPYFHLDSKLFNTISTDISILMSQDLKKIATYALNLALSRWNFEAGYATEHLSDAAGINYLNMFFIKRYISDPEYKIEMASLSFGKAFDYSFRDELSFDEQKALKDNRFVTLEFAAGLKAGLSYHIDDKLLGWRFGLGFKSQSTEFALEFMKNYVTDDLYGSFEKTGRTLRFTIRSAF